MSDVTPATGDRPPPPPGQPGPEYWQQASPPPPPAAGHHEEPPQRPPTFGEPPSVQPVYGTRVQAAPLQVAGFWRRAWARAITTLYWGIVVSAGIYAISAFTLFLAEAAPIRLVPLIGLIACVLFGTTMTYLIWSRTLATHNGTIGMRQMGIAIQGASNNPTVTRTHAFRRSLLPLLPLIYWTGTPVLVLYNPKDSTIALLLIIGCALTLLVLLGGLWMLVSARRQTAWDIVGDTVVVIDRQASWFAVLGFMVGLLVPVAATITIKLVGADRLQTEFRRLSGLGASGRYLLYSVPGFLISIVAIVIGHLAIRSTKWETRRLAGRGLARTGLLLGYSFPIAVVLVLAFSVIYRQVEDRQTRSCSEEKAAIAVAAESFYTLNGAYPRSITVVEAGIYLNDPDLSERWDFGGTTQGIVGLDRLEGIGTCKKA